MLVLQSTFELESVLEFAWEFELGSGWVSEWVWMWAFLLEFEWGSGWVFEWV